MTQGSDTNRRPAPKPIVCYCATCKAKIWSLTEIRRECGANGGNPDQVCNGLTLPKIAKLIDHPLRYLDDTPAGKWTPSAPVAREDGTKTPWMHNTDEAAYDVEFFARNPMRMTAADPPREGT